MNSQESQALASSSRFPFEVNRLTGVIKLKSSVDPTSIDREIQDQFYFTVMAEDADDSNLNDTASVVINIKDINDQHPVFQNTVVDEVSGREKLVFYGWGWQKKFQIFS